MENYDKLYFRSFQIKAQKIKYTYFLDGVEISSALEFKNCPALDLREPQYQEIIFHLGIVEAFPYIRYLPKEFVIEAGAINLEDKKFYTQIFTQGLSQFFYSEKIPFSKFPKITGNFSSKDKPLKKSLKKYAIIGNGGGKDGTIAYEAIKNCQIPRVTFTGALTYQDKGIPNNLKERLKFARLLNDKKIKGPAVLRRYDLSQIKNKSKRFYPHLYTYAFQMAVVALYKKAKYIVVANEKSSDYGNCIWRGHKINHQYSKSLSAEKLIYNFLQRKIHPQLHYFSLIKPVYGLKIIEKISQYPKYLPYFQSCNFAFRKKNKQWCQKCSKCAFMFVTLAGVIDDFDYLTTKIFSRDLFKDKKLYPVFIDLMGSGKHKPFECVGEAEEVWLSLENILKNNINNPVTDFYKSKVRPKVKNKLPYLRKKYNKVYSKHNLPSEIKKCILKELA